MKSIPFWTALPPSIKLMLAVTHNVPLPYGLTLQSNQWEETDKIYNQVTNHQRMYNEFLMADSRYSLNCLSAGTRMSAPPRPH